MIVIYAKKVGRSIQTPTMLEDGKLRKEVCKFLDLPVLDTERQNAYFWSPEMTRKYLERNNPPLNDLKTLMGEKHIHHETLLKKDKDKDKTKK